MEKQFILLVAREAGEVVQLKRELTLLDFTVLVLTKSSKNGEELPVHDTILGVAVWAFGWTREGLFEQVRTLTNGGIFHPIVIANEIPEGDRFHLFRLGISALLSGSLSNRELALRIHGLLEISGPVNTGSAGVAAWQLGRHVIRIDENLHKIFKNGIYVKLTETEWRVLHYLASRAGAICSREAIVDHCMGYESPTAYLRSLDTHIKNIRKKLGPYPWIETVRGYGYQFTGTVLSPMAREMCLI